MINIATIHKNNLPTKAPPYFIVRRLPSSEPATLKTAINNPSVQTRQPLIPNNINAATSQATFTIFATVETLKKKNQNNE